jgi:hypothetical protein
MFTKKSTQKSIDVLMKRHREYADWIVQKSNQDNPQLEFMKSQCDKILEAVKTISEKPND